jgi:hypothetical protein
MDGWNLSSLSKNPQIEFCMQEWCIMNTVQSSNVVCTVVVR